jgi:TolB-like protein/Tfp pilus assembly protein PilF
MELAAGVHLGPYEILAPLGTGGMATVYLADDARHHRKVAVKVLDPGVAREIGRERFAREIEISAGLRHPRTLPLFDSGETDGLLYYVMPHIEGETLRERLARERRLGPDEALRLTAEVAEALAYAHGREVVHRDIKPENILLEGGHALVMDFGIARAMEATGNPRVTMTGVTVGTPVYMSPEQITGGADVDGRSDLYGLACVLFEMLSGAPPFGGPTVEAILIQRLTQPPPRLSSVLPGAASRIDAALFRAMARDPADRFPSVLRFIEALQATATRTGRSAEKSIAVLPFSNLGGAAEDEYFSDGITEEIINALAQLEGLRVAARTSTFSFKGKHEDLRLIGEKLNVGTVLEGSVRRAGNRLRITAQLIDVADGYHLWSERYDRELTDIFAIQDEIATAVAAKFRVEGARDREDQRVRRATSNLEAYELYLKGRALQTRRGRSVVQAMECFERAVTLDPNFGEALGMLSDSWRLLSVYGLRPPEEAMTRAREASERALAVDPDNAEAYATLADVATSYDRDYDRAFKMWDRALSLNPEHGRARSERAVWGLAGIRGEFEEGIAECRKTVALDPLNAYLAGMLSMSLTLAGRAEEGMTEARRGIEMDGESFTARWMLVQSSVAAGRFADALEAATAALPMSGRNPWMLAGVAAARAGLGDRAAAEAIDDELRARARHEFVQLYTLVSSATAAGRMDEAMALAERSVDERDTIVLLARLLGLWKPLRAHPRFGELERKLGVRQGQPRRYR